MAFGEVVFALFMVSLWVGWIVLVITVLIDVLRSDDLSGWAKAGWTVFVVIATWLGVVVYLVARGQGMNERRFAHTAAMHQAQASRSASVESGSDGQSTADEIATLADLRDSGALTDEEFQAQKASLLT